MSGSRAWLLVLALIAFPHTEWIQDVADAPGLEGNLLSEPVHLDAGPLVVATFDALVIAAVLGRPLGRVHWLAAAVFVIDLVAGAVIGDHRSIPGFEEDAGYWVATSLYAAATFTVLLLTVRVWIARQGSPVQRRPRWVVPFMLGTAVAYAADIVAYGTYCDGHPCVVDEAFAKGAVPAIDADFFELSAQVIAGLLIAIVVEGAFHAGRGERQDRVLRSATVAMLAIAALFCLSTTLAVGTEVGGADAREDVVQVPLAFVVSVQALVTGFAALLMAAREPPAET